MGVDIDAEELTKPVCGCDELRELGRANDVGFVPFLMLPTPKPSVFLIEEKD